MAVVLVVALSACSGFINAAPSHDSRGQDAEELLFDYLEQSRLLIGSLKHPSLSGKIEADALSELQAMAERIKYHDDLEIALVPPVLSTLLPRMDYFYRSLQAQKRSIYIDSNEDINRITSQLAYVSISVLGLCVLIGVILSAWMKKSTTRRLKNSLSPQRAVAAS